MYRAGVVGDKYRQPRLRRGELRDCQPVKEDCPGRKELSHTGHHLSLFRSGEDDDADLVVSSEVIGDLGKVFQGTDTAAVAGARKDARE